MRRARRWGSARLGRHAGRRPRACSTSSTATISTSMPRSARLSVANRQRVEIAKALSQNARVVIMDEPTAALAEADVQRLMDDRPRACASAASASSMSATSCRRSSRSPTASRCCATAPMSAPGRSARSTRAELVSMMVGRAIDQLFPQGRGEAGRDRCSSCATSPTARWSATSPSTLRAGEILGIAGLVGSGRTELALTIFGITPATSGEILIDGKPVTIAQPRGGARPRHRLCAGGPRAAGADPAADHRARTSRWPSSTASPAASWSTAARRCGWPAKAIAALRHPRPRARADRARSSPAATSRRWCWPSGSRPSPRILIMDEPTRGIDVGAKAEIHALMRRLAGRGPGHPDDLQRAARGARHERPRAGDERRPDRRSLRRGGRDAGSRGRRHDRMPARARRPA